MVPGKIENQVITLLTVCEIFFGVVDRVLCSERSNQLRIMRAAYASHMRAKDLGKLYAKCSYASRRAIDEDMLASLDLSFIAEALQGRERCDGARCRILEGDCLWFRRQRGHRRDRVLREGAAAGAEHRVARCELCDARPDTFYLSGNVNSGLPELAPPR